MLYEKYISYMDDLKIYHERVIALQHSLRTTLYLRNKNICV